MRRRSERAERLRGEVVEYLRASPATRSMLGRDIRGSNESVHGTVDELVLEGTVVRDGKTLRLACGPAGAKEMSDGV